MKGLSCVFLVLLSLATTGSAQLKLAPNPGGSNAQLWWPAAVTNGSGEAVYPEYQLQYKADLRQPWTDYGGKLRGMGGRTGEQLSRIVPKGGASALFFRVLGDNAVPTRAELARDGAEVFGYGMVFSNELARIGQLSVQDFATNAGATAYLPQLTWDPTTARFWTNFQSTNLYRMVYGPLVPRETVYYNFQLDSTELPFFLTNGFVVSERLGSPTFGDAYYRLFQADLPLFVTSDSILHAWHMSFEALLQEIENVLLSRSLERLLLISMSRLQDLHARHGQGCLSNSIGDADYLLAVARSLFNGKQEPLVVGTANDAVGQMLAQIYAGGYGTGLPFASDRVIDFSLFKPRGHYNKNERLQRYFRTMMWLGHVDLRVLTFAPNQEDDTRQFGTAIVLSQVLESGIWSSIDRVTTSFFGQTDSMTPNQLGDLLLAWGLASPAELSDGAALETLQTSLLTGSVGAQMINSALIWVPFGPEEVCLARSFTVFGQKFTPDSWAMSQVAFDHVRWDGEAPGMLPGKVLRRKASCLDAAYAVLGNNTTVPLIVERITATNGVPFRDGLPYQHNLLAARRTLESQNPASWRDSMSSAWLHALQALSEPTVAPQFPEAMRTRAWAMKDLNTQLASWTQRRHDTVLYFKQYASGPVLCSYPAGFLEPRPELYSRLSTLARVTADAVSKISTSGFDGQIDRVKLKAHELTFLTNFSKSMLTLQRIAEKELAQQPLSSDESGIFENFVERQLIYTGFRQWTGWYPSLFYTNYALSTSVDIQATCSDVWDPLVTDVHTDSPDVTVGDPGAVIHEAVGNPHMLLIAIDNGLDRTVYAGPVLSHYEFETPPTVRFSDAEWGVRLLTQKPESPHWTRSYLVPGTIHVPETYR